MTVLFCTLVFLFSTLSGNPVASKLASLMEARYRGAKTLQTTFLERYSENGSVLRSEAGTAYFRRPGKMRWEYERPEKDLFLVDGKTAWFYVPADHTVTRVPAKQSGDLRTPLALLAGQMKISRICANVDFVQNIQPLRQENAVLRCRTRGQKQEPGTSDSLETADSESIIFEIAQDTGELARLIVRQAGAIEVEFRFENWRFDPSLPENMFRFEPPVGVAIVHGDVAESRGNSN
jgi:outer membrane lipoprotein carrier protein